MRIIAHTALMEAFKTMINFPLDTIKATLLFTLAWVLLVFASLTPPLIIFYAITAIGLWSMVTSIIFFGTLLISLLVAWYFVSSYTAAYVRTMFDLYNRHTRVSLFRFIDLGLMYGTNYFTYVVVKNFILLIFLMPIIGIFIILNIFDPVIIISVLLPIYTIVWFITLFIPCSIIVDDVHAFVAIKRGVKFIIRHPIDSIITAIIIVIPFVIFSLIPIIGTFLNGFLLMPIAWLTMTITYYNGR
ncbi:hypothetical protein J7J90_01090 [Candidatus Micrarchaeota archaeon]|nr:hypothetical protein [Candidatus Micrarchaeota archaeon]